MLIILFHFLARQNDKSIYGISLIPTGSRNLHVTGVMPFYYEPHLRDQIKKAIACVKQMCQDCALTNQQVKLDLLRSSVDIHIHIPSGVGSASFGAPIAAALKAIVFGTPFSSDTNAFTGVSAVH